MHLHFTRSTTMLAIAASLALTPLSGPAQASQSSYQAARAALTPASAGKLTVGEPEVFWPQGHHEVTPARPSAAAANDLNYGGGTGQGIISRTPAVYLVFWGSQWSQTDAYATYLQDFLRGLYGTGDDWSTVTQQFCQGVSAGTQTCPGSAQHVGVPSGSLLKGVWFDNALPAVPEDLLLQTGNAATSQIASEAVKAAAHFGNTTSASNVEAQYVIALPHLAPPPGFGAYYCAYHTDVTSSYGNLAWTNLPYLTDVPTCGKNSVNAGSGGTYDGVSIVEGHEYLEVITDMRPSTGWTDSSGAENADKCAWTGLTNLNLSTGRFAVQPTWSNSAHGCVAHTT